MTHRHYLVRSWVDPYNERGQYRHTEAYHQDLIFACQLADRAERAVVLDLDDLYDSHASRLIYTRGVFS